MRSIPGSGAIYINEKQHDEERFPKPYTAFLRTLTEDGQDVIWGSYCGPYTRGSTDLEGARVSALCTERWYCRLFCIHSQMCVDDSVCEAGFFPPVPYLTLHAKGRTLYGASQVVVVWLHDPVL